MALPFAEAAKGSQSLMSQTIGRVIQQTSPIAEYISVKDTMGHRTYTWFTDRDPGSNTWTAVNEDLTTSSTGQINEFIVAVSRLSRYMKVDKGLAKIPKRGEELKAQQLRMAGVAYGLDFTNVFFTGASASNPKQPNGIAALVNAQVANGTMPAQQLMDAGSGGAPLTLAMMADLQSRVWPDENGAFYMNRDLFLYFNSLIRDSSAAGYYRIEEDRSMFGKPIVTFGGWPVRVVMRTDNYSTPLPFTESATALTGGSTGSVWAVSHDPDLGAFCVAEGGIGMSVGPFVDLQINPFLQSFTMHEYAFGLGGPRACARLYDVANPNS
jgi:hypothetical protein